MSVGQLQTQAEAMAEVLAEIPGLRVFEWQPDTLNPPAVVIGLPRYTVERIGCFWRRPVPVTLLLPRSNPKETREQFDRYERSIIEALEGDERLSRYEPRCSAIDIALSRQVAGGDYVAVDLVIDMTWEVGN